MSGNMINIDPLLNFDDSSVAVSMLAPTIRSGKERRQNEIRLKNLISEAETKLLRMGDVAAAELLAPARDILGDSDALRHPQDGVAIYLAPEFSLIETVPFELPERIDIGRRFHITPLLPAILDDTGFHLLVVSSNEVRLFAGNRFKLLEETPDTLPTDLRSALRIDEFVSSLQQHSLSGGDGGAMFHGQGGSDPDVRKRDELLEYFYRLDKAVDEFLTPESGPLVFAGVDYLFPLYRQANSVEQLFGEPLTGNFDGVDAEELHRQVWPLLEPHFSERDREPLTEFGMLRHQNLASDDLQEIIRAARSGRAENLFIGEGAAVPGRIDVSSGQVHCGEFDDGEDLINYAALHVLRTGGEVRLISEDELPTDSPCAAIFRYANESSAPQVHT